MPPQNTQVPPSPVSPMPSMDSLQKNPKFIVTVKTFVIYGAIAWLITSLVGMLTSSFGFSGYYSSFNVVSLVMALIMGAIGSAVGAAIFYFIYDPLHNWVKGNSFLSKYIHDMFSLMWKPYLVGIIISAAFGLLSTLGLTAVTAGIGMGALFIGWIITFVVDVAVYYWYAKTVSSKLSGYYPW